MARDEPLRTRCLPPGLLHASHLALITAVALELRDDAGELRQQAAAAALRGLAEGLKADTAHQTDGESNYAKAQHA